MLTVHVMEQIMIVVILYMMEFVVHSYDYDYDYKLHSDDGLSAEDYSEVWHLTQNISDEIQRNITAQQLLYCPNVPLCNNLTRSKLGRLFNNCCKPCSCGTETIPPNGQHCPNYKFFNQKTSKSCIRPQYLMFRQTDANADLSYFMMTQCPSDFKDNEIKKKCTMEERNENVLRLSSFVPVTSNRNNVTYLNYYCAICNKEDDINLIDWKVSISCMTENAFKKPPRTEYELLEMIKKYKTCNILFEPTVEAVEECSWGEYTTCNQTGKWKQYDHIIKQGCQGYTALYTNPKYGWYKNVFCLMCNENIKPKPQCAIFTGVHLPVSFSSLVRYRRPSKISAINSCKEGEFFDNLQNICKIVECPPYSTFVDNACKLMLKSSPRQNYRVLYHSTFTTIYKCNTKCCGEIMVSSFKNAIKSKFNDTVLIDIRVLTFLSNMSTYNENIFIFNVTLGANKPHDQRKYLHILTSLQQMTFIYNGTIIKVKTEVISQIALETEYSLKSNKNYINTIGEKECMDKDFSDFEDLNNTVNKPSNEVAGPDFSYPYPKPPVYHSNAFAPPDYIFERRDIVHVTNNYYCPRLKFKIDDVDISETELLIPNVNVKYNVSDVIIHGNYVMVCLGPYNEATKRKNGGTNLTNLQEGVLSLICSTLSIISLVLTLIVYSLFKELRTIPGINNMILSGHLILANLFYMIGVHVNSYNKLCTAFGIFTHYLWLSSIMWMHCCSIHMFRVFTRMKELRNFNQSMRPIAIYTVYVVVTSVTLVTSNIVYAVLTDYNAPNKSGYLGYGGEACYISNPKMVLITFVIPIGIILISNIVLFFIVIYRIQKLPTMNAANKTSRNNFIIYIKLTCLTGVTWIFGFIYQWTVVQTFSYIFIVLNASQGVFIFISFCCNARVRNMCRSKFLQRKNIQNTATKEFEL